MSDSPLVSVDCLFTESVDTLAAASGAGAGDDELISALTWCEGAERRLNRVTVAVLASLGTARGVR